jgi:hypothetical protein
MTETRKEAEMCFFHLCGEIFKYNLLGFYFINGKLLGGLGVTQDIRLRHHKITCVGQVFAINAHAVSSRESSS